jgi:hypothetical protein
MTKDGAKQNGNGSKSKLKQKNQKKIKKLKKFKHIGGMKRKHFQSSWDELPLWELGMLCSSKLLG